MLHSPHSFQSQAPQTFETSVAQPSASLNIGDNRGHITPQNQLQYHHQHSAPPQSNAGQPNFQRNLYNQSNYTGQIQSNNRPQHHNGGYNSTTTNGAGNRFIQSQSQFCANQNQFYTPQQGARRKFSPGSAQQGNGKSVGAHNGGVTTTHNYSTEPDYSLDLSRIDEKTETRTTVMVRKTFVRNLYCVFTS